MLPHHQPLVVAEQFATLSAFAPGRVDLGLGRPSGFTAPVRRALRQALRDFTAETSRSLRRFLDGTAETTLHPQPDGSMPLHVLATGSGLQVAAELGLPVIVGGHLLGLNGDPAPGLEALAGYRRAFQPSSHVPESRVALSLDVLIADTATEAAELLLPERGRWRRAVPPGCFRPWNRWQPSGLPRAPRRQQQYLEQTAAAAIAGTPTQVERQRAQLLDSTGAAELVATGSAFDRAALAASDSALAALFGRVDARSPAMTT